MKKRNKLFSLFAHRYNDGKVYLIIYFLGMKIHLKRLFNLEKHFPETNFYSQYKNFSVSFYLDFAKSINTEFPKIKMPPGLNTLCVLKEKDIALVDTVFITLNKSNFRYVLSKNITCTLISNSDENILFSLNNITKSKKEQLSEYDNIVLFNPTLHECILFNSISNSYYIICVISELTLYSPEITNYVDAIILNSSVPVKEDKIKRIYYATTQESIANGISDIIKQRQKHEFEMMVPIYGSVIPNRDLYLELATTNQYDGIIYITSTYIPSAGTHKEQIYNMISHIKHIVVSCSVFHTYFTLAQQCREGKNLENFLLRALSDGVRFHVKQI